LKTLICYTKIGRSATFNEYTLQQSGYCGFVYIQILTLILTVWEFKKASFVKMKISPGWLKQNIFLKIKNA
jgi:hypothetical protein